MPRSPKPSHFSLREFYENHRGGFRQKDLIKAMAISEDPNLADKSTTYLATRGYSERSGRHLRRAQDNGDIVRYGVLYFLNPPNNQPNDCVHEFSYVRRVMGIRVYQCDLCKLGFVLEWLGWGPVPNDILRVRSVISEVRYDKVFVDAIIRSCRERYDMENNISQKALDWIFENEKRVRTPAIVRGMVERTPFAEVRTRMFTSCY